MANNIVNIGVDKDAYLIFMATRIYTCMTLHCDNNDDAQCKLKRVNILDNGQCSGFRPRVYNDPTAEEKSSE